MRKQSGIGDWGWVRAVKDTARDAANWANNNVAKPTAQFARQLGYSGLSTLGSVSNTLTDTVDALHVGASAGAGALARYAGADRAADFLNNYTQSAVRLNAKRNKQYKQYQRYLARAAGWNNLDNLSNLIKIPGTNIGMGDASGTLVTTALAAGPVGKALKFSVAGIPQKLYTGARHLAPTLVRRGVPASVARVLPNAAATAGAAVTTANTASPVSQTLPTITNFVNDHVVRLPQNAVAKANQIRERVRSFYDSVPGLRWLNPIYGLQRTLQQQDPNTGNSYISQPMQRIAWTSLANPDAFRNGQWWNPRRGFVSDALNAYKIPDGYVTQVRVDKHTQDAYDKALSLLSGQRPDILVPQYKDAGDTGLQSALARMTPAERKMLMLRLTPVIGSSVGAPTEFMDITRRVRDKYLNP